MNQYNPWHGKWPASMALIFAGAALTACGSGGGSSSNGGGNHGGGPGNGSEYAAVETGAATDVDLTGSDALAQAAARYLMAFRAAQLAEMARADFSALVDDAVQEAGPGGVINCDAGAVQVTADSQFALDQDPFAAGSYQQYLVANSGCRLVAQDGSITELEGALSAGQDNAVGNVSFVRWGAAAGAAFDMKETFDDETFLTRISGVSVRQQGGGLQDLRTHLAFRASDQTLAWGTTRFALDLAGEGGAGDFRVVTDHNDAPVLIQGRIGVDNDGGEHGACQISGRYDIRITDLDGLNGVPAATLTAGAVEALIEPGATSFSVAIGADLASYDLDDVTLWAWVDACISDD